MSQKWRSNFNSLWRSYKRNAKKRDIEWKLTKSQFAILTQEKCYLCGAKPQGQYVHDKDRADSPYTYNGIDRLDSSGPYEMQNCRPCCTNCNRMKWDMDLNDFKRHIFNIVKRIL